MLTVRYFDRFRVISCLGGMLLSWMLIHAPVATAQTIVIGPAEKSFNDVIENQTALHNEVLEKNAELMFEQTPPFPDDDFTGYLKSLQDAEEESVDSDELAKFQISLIDRYLYGENAQTAATQQTSHIEKYCSSGSSFESNAFDCSDVNVSNQHGESRSFLAKSAYTQSEKEQIEDYIHNILIPIPKAEGKTILSSQSELDKPANQEKLSKLRSRAAKLAIAGDSFYTALQLRLQPETQTTIIPGLGADVTTGKSVMEVLEEVFNTPLAVNSDGESEWLNRVVGASDTELQRDALKLNAFRAYLDLLRYKQNERIEFLLAANLVSTIQSSSSTADAISAAQDF